MTDHFTPLENALDALYTDRMDKIADAQFVLSWDDYNFRAGYLRAIRDVGVMIKKARNPETPEETGEIPSILEEIKNV